MDLTFGKHSGKSVEMLLLKEPQYLGWMLTQKDARGVLKQAQDHARKKIAEFNGKPFTKKCGGHLCSEVATRCTVYLNNVTDPRWWCEDCNPYQAGANAGKLQSLKTYSDAYQHVGIYCSGRVSDYRAIILAMAKAKGLPARVGEKQALEFFS